MPYLILDSQIKREENMSYSPMRNEDSLSEYFSAASDFYVLSKKMLLNKHDIDRFIIWYDKCYSIDPRATVLFLIENYNVFSQDIRSYIFPVIKRYTQTRG